MSIKVLFIGQKKTVNYLAEYAHKVFSVLFEYNHIQSVEEGYRFIQAYIYDAVIIEARSCKRPCAFIERVRAQKKTVPLIFLNSTSTYSQKKINHIYMQGGDDVIHPFMDILEFLHRLKALIRRVQNNGLNSIEVGNLKFDITKGVFCIHKKYLCVTLKEFLILKMLVLNTPWFIPKDNFLDYIYSGQSEPDRRIIDTYIASLRHKLKKMQCTAHIETQWGNGYRIVDMH